MNLEEAQTWLRNVELELKDTRAAQDAACVAHCSKFHEYQSAADCVRMLERRLAENAKEVEE